MPMLKRGELPPLNSETFLGSCAQVLPEKTVARLSEIKLVPGDDKAFGHFSAVHKWYEWETATRTRLAKFRAVHLNREGRNHETNHSEVDKHIEDIMSVANPVERERMLDTLRWKFLDELEFGQNFNFDALCIYRIRLMLLEKWVGKEQQKGYENLDAIINNLEKYEVSISR
ncbi:MAG: hypothetical protein A2X45_10715 [Lentisphaerae bacterium GWF2_50_93]|nr:MAG: hypothetical protein A2X45_10715 [Lentisphaerae bacterium GWF2_50_93]